MNPSERVQKKEVAGPPERRSQGFLCSKKERATYLGIGFAVFFILITIRHIELLQLSGFATVALLVITGYYGAETLLDHSAMKKNSAAPSPTPNLEEKAPEEK